MRGCIEPGQRQKEGPEFPLEVAPEPVGRGGARGCAECHSNLLGASKGAVGAGGEGERLKEKEQEEGSQRSSSQVLLF